MPADIIVGLQWGDEGKGKIVDYIASQYDVIARYQGGRNAGHTVISGNKYVFHAIPSGVLHPGIVNVLGNGMVIDVGELRQEIDGLHEMGINISPENLMISHNAHIILPYHIEKEDSENLKKINTTGYGIGPTYESKAARSGLRINDFTTRNGRDYALEQIAKNTADDPNEIYEKLMRDLEFFKPFVNDISHFLNFQLETGKRVLCEGAQGTLLDVDHGTYPYVTSSNTTAGGAFTGLGIAPRHFGKVIGVTKAYTTRVGDGPFPTELGDQESVKEERILDKHSDEYIQLRGKVFNNNASDHEIGQYMRNVGMEWGSSTGRNRRCGWLDIPMLRYAMTINGVEELAIMKIDVLDGIPTLRICTEYDEIKSPTPSDLMHNPKPRYVVRPGWECETTGKNLDLNAERYLETISIRTGGKIRLISNGPSKHDTIDLTPGF